MQDETHLALGRIAEHRKRHRVKFVVIGGWSIDANVPRTELQDSGHRLHHCDERQKL